MSGNFTKKLFYRAQWAHLRRISIFRQFHKKFDFLRKFSKNFDFVSGNFTKNRFFRANIRKLLIFSDNFVQNFDFSWQISEKYRFSRKKLAFSGQIILFFCKSHHFRTYFLYMIRYNNILRPHDPVQPPTTPLPKIWGVATPIPPGLTPMCRSLKSRQLEITEYT